MSEEKSFVIVPSKLSPRAKSVHRLDGWSVLGPHWPDATRILLDAIDEEVVGQATTRWGAHHEKVDALRSPLRVSQLHRGWWHTTPGRKERDFRAGKVAKWCELFFDELSEVEDPLHHLVRLCGMALDLEFLTREGYGQMLELMYSHCDGVAIRYHEGVVTALKKREAMVFRNPFDAMSKYGKGKRHLGVMSYVLNPYIGALGVAAEGISRRGLFLRGAWAAHILVRMTPESLSYPLLREHYHEHIGVRKEFRSGFKDVLEDLEDPFHGCVQLVSLGLDWSHWTRTTYAEMVRTIYRYVPSMVSEWEQRVREEEASLDRSRRAGGESPTRVLSHGLRARWCWPPPSVPVHR